MNKAILTYKLPPSLIQTQQAKLIKYPRGNRTKFQHILDLQCEYPEYLMSQDPTTLHTIHEEWEYDTNHPVYGRCDFKCMNTKNNTTLSNKVIDNQYCDTFIIIKWITSNNKEFIENQNISFQIQSIIPYEEMKKKVEKSQFKGYYLPYYKT